MEAAIISGVTHDTSEAKVTITGVPDRSGIAARVFRALADEAVNVDMIVQNVERSGITDISFTLPKDDLKKAGKVIEGLVAEIGATGFDQDAGIARVSLVGAGMKTHPGVAATMFEVLAREGVNIEMISTSLDPHLLRGAGRPGRTGRAGAARRLRAGRGFGAPA